jgi:hypothetical protein
MDISRRSKIGTKSSQGIDNSSFIGLLTIGLTREDYLSQRTLRITLTRRIQEVAKKIVDITESSEGDKRINPIIEEYEISEDLFVFLVEEERLPEAISNRKIVYELVNYRLLVRVMPSVCHEYTLGCFDEDIFFWAASDGVGRTLRHGIGACTQLIMRLVNFTRVSVGGGHKKIPR